MGTSHASWVPPERFDEYQLVKALGRGSMGQVWLAQDTVLDRLVAVKFISELPEDAAAHQRFLTEARAAARVQHPNVIAIYRVGEIGARPYLISEYVRGDSLDRIARPVPSARLLEIAIGLARGLAAAHRSGVLHRDLKPANAILSEAGEVKLLDFGLAKLVHEIALPEAPAHAAAPPLAGDPTLPPPVREPGAPPASQNATPAPYTTEDFLHADTVKLIGLGPDEPPAAPPDARRSAGDGTTALAPLLVPPSHPLTEPPAAQDAGGTLTPLTSTAAAMGTPAYTPPEAWRGEPMTPRSDIYSLGALLYELATGTPPHLGGSQESMRSAALDTDAPPLATVAPGIDAQLAAIIDRCLRRDPPERFASGEAICESLEQLAARIAAGAPEILSTGASPVPLERTQPPQRRPPATVVIAALAAVAVVGVGLGLTVKHLLSGARSASRGRAVATGRCADDMVLVPRGSFLMGSPDGQGRPDEHPQHEVTLSSYCIDRTEVTVAAYEACAAAGACPAATATVKWSAYAPEDARRYSQWCNRSDRPDHPINCVDWDSAAAYCAWRGRRLPSEAEWEYAARGGDGRIYPWGNDAVAATRLNLCGAECAAMAARELHEEWKPIYDGNDGWPTTAPVGSYPRGASPLGLFDMAGNVWEWTADWYGSYSPSAETDPTGARSGTSRVSRGAGWASRGAHSARAADRHWLDPKARDCDLGFRCAQDH